MNRIEVKVTKGSDFYKLDRVGPTVKTAKKLPRSVGNDRILTAPPTKWKALKLLFTTTQESLTPGKIKRRKGIDY